ncbi:L-aspartate 1-decarboxylase [Geoalkalibacter ferrihydriticus]|uniref:Aspartate 1-decarboxylase n=2 Tax=Geoalkalibacter ferrihydriticus TaxID=392333 RepID=A0A0C2DQW3_9BACT|nr:aspartate 1-decarboxylase [Geoalkalibacter ferrihydriticus]KIH75824.1 aspartate decarboxylase [Geoalkalibacter ferrihydriticus DSM 17813]SDM66664.1 L-aspartate 1-decarboxylase [Geoalkalibacter ferrihydriticus]
MTRKMLKSKIHRATVTGADLHYEGSITIDRDLMEQSDIKPYEAVDIWNVTYGTRFQTYAIEGQPGSGTICINGAAARLVSRGDLVIIASWLDIPEAQVAAHEPKLVFVDEKNRSTSQTVETGGQADLKKAI